MNQHVKMELITFCEFKIKSQKDAIRNRPYNFALKWPPTMKVIPETCRAQEIRYLRFYL